jgi:hypothetical protein
MTFTSPLRRIEPRLDTARRRRPPHPAGLDAQATQADGFRALLFEACATTPGTAERLRPVMGVA